MKTYKIKDELVSFETAKLAKKKGFPIKLPYHEGHILEGNKPTQSLLQRWLREEYPKFRLHCIPNETDDEGWHYTLWDYTDDRLKISPSKFWIISDYYDSYEEALEKGLQKALNLIEI